MFQSNKSSWLRIVMNVIVCVLLAGHCSKFSVGRSVQRIIKYETEFIALSILSNCSLNVIFKYTYQELTY